MSSLLPGVHNALVFIRVERDRVDEVLELLSDKHHILPQQITTVPYSDGARNQVLFIFSANRSVQKDICKDLETAGIGEYGSGSDVSVIPLAISKDVRKKEEILAGVGEAPPPMQAKKTQLSVFQSTIKSRIAVENILEVIYQGASFSFDFFMLVVVASTLALIGLLTNSAVVLVSAMLVSPLMGPVMGITFGSVIRDLHLVKTAVKSAFTGLFIGFFIGLIGGLIAAPASMRQAPWPTNEMANRGDRSALYTGVAIAIPSGIGVALSIMGQNTNSLVGVAISASLLPPVVNFGVLLAQAALQSTYFNQECLDQDVKYAAYCCKNLGNSAGRVEDMGGISLALTLVNIACIWLFGALTFLFKEVAPLPNKSELWTTLVPNARKFNQAMNRGEITGKLMEEEIRRERAKHDGRHHLGGHKLERGSKIERSAIDTRQYGAANGVVFPTESRKRGFESDFIRNLVNAYKRHEDDDDSVLV